MVADMNVHWDMGKDGQPKPHAHVMLSMREVGPEVFGQKVREWNSTALLQEWRVAWADHVNERLAELDIDARIDHRRSEEHTSELQSLMRISYAVFCWKKKNRSTQGKRHRHILIQSYKSTQM